MKNIKILKGFRRWLSKTELFEFLQRNIEETQQHDQDEIDIRTVNVVAFMETTQLADQHVFYI
uniref:Uncharacterized protein n=1 Tax=Glossina pallidipes TaxID=7398 RepID=A0A1A9ZUL8_GLOPL